MAQTKQSTYFLTTWAKETFPELKLKSSADLNRYERPAVYILKNKKNGFCYVGKSNLPFNRLRKHLLGNGSSTSWFINNDNWEDFEIELYLLNTEAAATDLEKTLIKQFGDKSYNGYFSTNKLVHKKSLIVNGIQYSTIKTAAKANNVNVKALHKAINRAIFNSTETPTYEDKNNINVEFLIEPYVSNCGPINNQDDANLVAKKIRRKIIFKQYTGPDVFKSIRETFYNEQNQTI
jgi:predicted GIY-YIG superfamily endonuclease